LFKGCQDRVEGDKEEKPAEIISEKSRKMAPTVEQVSANGPDLKYLNFFRLAIVKVYVLLVSFYEYLKQSSGIFSASLDRLESVSQSVVGPVYSKIEGKPDELLKFVDTKVDGALGLADSYTPVYVKQKSTQLYGAVKAAPENLKTVHSDIKTKGVVSTSKTYYEKYYPLVVDELYQFWKVLLTLSLIATLAKALVPQAKFGLEKYNSLAEYLKANEKLKAVGSYLPTVPVDDFVKTVNADTDAALKQKKID